MTGRAGFYRNKFGHVIVQVYDPERRGTRKVARAECAHLDGAADEVVVRWRQMYLDRLRGGAQENDAVGLLPTEEAAFLFRAFMDEHQSLRKTSNSTRSDEEGRWRGYVVKYFVVEKAERDVRQWCLHISGFASWLMATGLKTNQQKKVINLARRFGEFLLRHRKIRDTWAFLLPVDNASAATPLCYELRPEEVLAFASSECSRAKLMALVGYFASLRPEETFVLQKSDFLTGDRARIASRTYDRLSALGLGSGLSVAIARASKKDGAIGEPKTRSSKAVVNIWHPEGARAIASLLSGMPDGWLFPGDVDGCPLRRDTQFKFWSRFGLKAGPVESPRAGLVTLHDLRRSSCLYLGRTLDVPVALLQEHMRHSDLKTTMLYMRRPEITFAAPSEQNWNDVG